MSLISLVDSFNNRISGSRISVQGSHHSSGNSEKFNVSGETREDLNRDEVKSVVDELNKLSSVFNDNIIRFTLHEKTNRIVIKVINSETDEIVREIPAKHSIRLLEHFKEHMGVFIDKSI